MRASPIVVLACAVVLAGCGSDSEPSAAPPPAPAPDPGGVTTLGQPGTQPEQPRLAPAERAARAIRVQPGRLHGRPDPRGGALVVLWGPTGTGDCIGEAYRYDATGARADGTGRVGCLAFAADVSTEGEALVLEPPPGGGFGSTVLRWLTREGAPARPPSEEAFRPTGQLLPLLDGSLVAVQGLTYVRRYPRLSAASEPAPAWLSARAGESFRFTRGNRGYAFFPAPGASSTDCTQAVELVAPSGRRCARLTFRRDGKACQTGAIDQGRDGTVVQQTSSGACGWRLWPRLLAGE